MPAQYVAGTHQCCLHTLHHAGDGGMIDHGHAAQTDQFSLSQLFSNQVLHAHDSARLCLSVSNSRLMQSAITARLQQTGADLAFQHTRSDISTVICIYLHAVTLHFWYVPSAVRDLVQSVT